MAILGFHFSGIFGEKLLNKAKTATIMSGEWNFKPGQEVFVYLSDKPNLFDDVIERRIGKATITDVCIKQVKNLTEEEAKTCGAEDLSKEKELMCKFYNTDDNSTITYVRFNLELQS